VRLAQDIHSIMEEVTEGGDPSFLKHMLSNKNARSRRTPRTPCTGYRRRLKTTPGRKEPIQCACVSHLKFLKDTVSALQADVLLLKQETQAT